MHASGDTAQIQSTTLQQNSENIKNLFNGVHALPHGLYIARELQDGTALPHTNAITRPVNAQPESTQQSNSRGSVFGTGC